MLRFLAVLAISTFFSAAANAACVAPAGTYTGGARLLLATESNGSYYRIGQSGQMSLNIPEKGNWISQSWVKLCVTKYDGDPAAGGSISSQQCSSNLNSPSSQAQKLITESRADVLNAQSNGWPGIGTAANKFDTNTCHGLIKIGKGAYVSYVVNDSGSTIELLYSFDQDVSSSPESDLLPMILHRT